MALETGDASSSNNAYEPTYAALGEALSRWSSVENTLCYLYAFCLNRHNLEPAIRGFWEIQAFEAKLRMANAVIRSNVKHWSDLDSEWKKPYKKLTSKNKMRNKLAHGTVVLHIYGHNDNLRSDIFLAPFMYSRLMHNLLYHQSVDAKALTILAQRIDYTLTPSGRSLQISRPPKPRSEIFHFRSSAS